MNSPFKLARRAARMNPSVIREILKLTEKPGVISFAGGLPSPRTFPVEAMREACGRVLRDDALAALQYAASEGFEPLREWVAADLLKQGLRVNAARVLITTGSQQGLDLLAKILIDAGSTVLVESPTYLGALQAFTTMEPRFASVAGDDDGPIADAMVDAAQAAGADARASFTCCRTSRTRPGAPSPMRAVPRWPNARRRSACRWSRTTPTATSGSTPRRRPAWLGATLKARCTLGRSRRCWRRACAWATSSRRRV